MKNFFVLGWGIGALGITAYKTSISKKEPSTINAEMLKKTAMTYDGNDNYYKFKNRNEHLNDIK